VKLLNWVLVFLGASMILAEVLLGAATGFDLLLLGSAIALGGAMGLVVNSTAVGLAAAGLLSLAYLLVGRSRLRRRLQRPNLPTNTDALIDRTALVVQEIAGHRPGRVKLEGDEWRAELEPSLGPAASLPPGTRVRIVRLEGVTVYVVPA